MALAGLIIAAVLVGTMLVVMIVLNSRKPQDRAAGIAALARSRGWTFTGPTQPLLDDVMRYDRCDRSESTPLIQRDPGVDGRGPWMHNTVVGELSIGGRLWPFRAADCEFDAWTNQNDGGTYRFGYLSMDVPVPREIAMEIRPRDLTDQVADALGRQDIHFESDEFNRTFRVTCTDRRAAFGIVSPEMMEFLLKERPIPIYIEGGVLCLTDGIATWDAFQLDRIVSWARRFVSLCHLALFDGDPTDGRAPRAAS